MDRSNGKTRRRVLKTGIGVTAAGVLAGCGGSDAEDESETTQAETTAGSTPSAAATTTSGGEGGGANGETSYSVEMEPVGEVTFESVPERWATYTPGYADMGVALGEADGLLSVGYKPRFYTRYYDELDGVSVDKESLTQLYDDGIDKEIFYEMDADVHVVDPNWLSNNFGSLDASDVEEVRSSVAPFVGNTIFRQTDDWHDYRYYSMYEAFETVAQLFQATDRYEAFVDLHEEYIEGRVADQFPSEDERPEVGIVYGAGDQPEEFAPYRLETAGTATKHWKDLGVHDAFAGSEVEGLSTTNRTQIDFETLASVDPDALLVRGQEHKTAEEFRNTVLAFMKEHPVASTLSAVENDRVFRGGPVYQGPIQNLFLVERGAKDLYPDTFSGELFDRDRVADIVNGEI
jgi:iron complex transport system substrate-binding protein